MSANQYFEAIRTWASSFQQIHRVWLFGRRIKGTARPDSDLDVAVEIDPELLRGEKHFAYWMFESPGMKSALRSALSVEPHVQQYHADETQVFLAV